MTVEHSYEVDRLPADGGWLLRLLKQEVVDGDLVGTANVVEERSYPAGRRGYIDAQQGGQDWLVALDNPGEKMKETAPATPERFNDFWMNHARREAERPKIKAEGEAALRRLFDFAHGDHGQCKIVAKFLLGCYNGERFPFDLSDFRCLDANLFDDCLAVLKMDARPRHEVHEYFPLGSKKFEKLAADWNIADHWAMRIDLGKYQERMTMEDV